MIANQSESRPAGVTWSGGLRLCTTCVLLPRAKRRRRKTCKNGFAVVETREMKVQRLTPVLLSLYHNCDSTTTRLIYDDTTMHSTTTEVIEITICVPFDFDTTTTRLRRKIDMLIFCSSNGSRRARYVVVGS